MQHQATIAMDHEQNAEPLAETFGKQIATILPQPPVTDGERAKAK